jgi:hypothetical protein
VEEANGTIWKKLERDRKSCDVGGRRERNGLQMMIWIKEDIS